MEKIKISINKATLDTLKKDCVDFLITKDNGQPNFNSFINILLNNYYEQFSAVEESLYDDIMDAVKNVPPRYREEIFDSMKRIIDKRTDSPLKKETTTFSFKPTKVGEKAINYIDNVLLKSESISSFYRRLLTSYTQKTKNEREKIIYKDTISLLQKALKKGVTVMLTMKNGTLMKDVSIYAMGESKDELYNYVLLFHEGKNVTSRLSKIRSVNLLNAKAVFPEKGKALFDKQLRWAIQYTVYNTDDTPIQVKLTPKGKILFEKIYLYRPEPVSIEGDIYTFECSANQLLFYFERFGEHALILQPKRTGIFMRNYYYFAYKKYRSIYKMDDKRI